MKPTRAELIASFKAMCEEQAATIRAHRALFGRASRVLEEAARANQRGRKTSKRWQAEAVAVLIDIWKRFGADVGKEARPRARGIKRGKKSK